jgi:uncharacterized membrane protein
MPLSSAWGASPVQGGDSDGDHTTDRHRAPCGGEQTPALLWAIVPTTMHAVIAFSSVPLLLGALLSDWAYFSSQEIQWVNFAAWLVAGGLLLAGPALVWGAVDVLRSPDARHRRGLIYLGLLLATFVVGIINALVHAMDGWAAMPTGLILSAVVLVLATAASAVGLAGPLRRTA